MEPLPITHILSFAGQLSKADKDRLDNLFHKALRRGVCSQSFTIDDLISATDKKLFRRITSNNNHCLHSLLPPKTHKSTELSQKSRTYYINCLKLNLTYLRTPFLADLFFHMCRLVFLSWLQFVQCFCILFLFYLTVLIPCTICFYYNVCDCHAFIKGNLFTYLLTMHTLIHGSSNHNNNDVVLMM